MHSLEQEVQLRVWAKGHSEKEKTLAVGFRKIKACTQFGFGASFCTKGLDCHPFLGMLQFSFTERGHFPPHRCIHNTYVYTCREFGRFW